MGDDGDVHEVSMNDVSVQEYMDALFCMDPMETLLTDEERLFLDSPHVEYLYSLFDAEEVRVGFPNVRICYQLKLQLSPLKSNLLHSNFHPTIC